MKLPTASSALATVIFFFMSAQSIAGELVRHTIHDGRDPLTPPQTKMECVDWASGHIPLTSKNWKTCKGHAMRCKYMKSRITLIISGDGPVKAARSCLNEALSAGLVAAIMTNPAAGEATAKAYLTGCLSTRVPKSLIKVENPTGWGNWGGC